jgi:hypothetical protein
MGKNILNEIKTMKYLLGYKRGVVISEQAQGEKDDLIDKYSSKSIANQIDSGDFANLNPAAADAIKQAQNMVGGQSLLPTSSSGTTSGATSSSGTTSGATSSSGTTSGATTQEVSTPATPIKIGVKYPSIEELQNTLITKFQSVLTKDGKYGPKTAASVLAALQKVPTNSVETKKPDTTTGDANSEVAKKTAETNASTNGVANNETNKNTQQPAIGGMNSFEVDGNEFS